MDLVRPMLEDWNAHGTQNKFEQARRFFHCNKTKVE
jgi:hypothetical protein